VRVLDLDPGGRDAVALIGAAAPLGDDALEIPVARRAEQITPARLQMINLEQA
jgi:hypothetical protein